MTFPISRDESALERLSADGYTPEKSEDGRVYEQRIFLDHETDPHNLLFFTPRMNCKIDNDKVMFFVPQSEDCETFYEYMNTIDKRVVELSQIHWAKWFADKKKKDLSPEEIADSFRPSVKAVTKEEQGRGFHTKLSQKCKMRKKVPTSEEHETCTTQDIGSKDEVVALVEMQKLIFGKGNFKIDYKVHQIEVYPFVEPVPPKNKPLFFDEDNEGWVELV